MGIKSIHVFLITSASIMAGIFGTWGLTHNYSVLGIASIACGFGLIIYCINFLKKAKTL